jgi:hypothetical protein
MMSSDAVCGQAPVMARGLRSPGEAPAGRAADPQAKPTVTHLEGRAIHYGQFFFDR